MNEHRFFDFADLSSREVYKLLAGAIVPRPIALVTSRDEQGRVNAAPYSFFNVLGTDPPILAISVGDRPEGGPNVGTVPKDTAANIRARGEFVVNMVSFELSEAMNVCAVDFPSGWSEIEEARLQLAPSQKVDVPRLAQSPASFECCEHTTLLIGRNRIILGEVVAAHLDVDTVNEQLRVDTQALQIIGRMGGAGGYVRAQDEFEMPRQTFEEWREKRSHDG